MAPSIRSPSAIAVAARLLLDMGRPAEALTHAEAALAVHTASNGPNHPWTKESAAVAVVVLDALGRVDEAAALRARFGLVSGLKLRHDTPRQA